MAETQVRSSQGKGFSSLRIIASIIAKLDALAEIITFRLASGLGYCAVRNDCHLCANNCDNNDIHLCEIEDCGDSNNTCTKHRNTEEVGHQFDNTRGAAAATCMLSNGMP
eukprot:TRINITY_DN4263_c0_g1_i1.p1 TRINITY_DN4263_c0_g1~~TRINITY_DN4263_c0_g1_i1.p1  ORF type:complete len:110 (+),score=11.65 TRINITY_DN4263_c0_g1_i1:270-599(+)